MPSTTDMQKSPRILARTACSSLLLYASFFPLNLGFLAWFALIPWISLIELPSRPRRLYLKTFTGALLFTLPAMQWMRLAHPAMYMTWIALALYTASYFVIALAICRKLNRSGVPIWLSVPLVWTGLEYCRAHFPTGFSWLESFSIQHFIGFGWYFLGYTQHDWSTISQIADLTGVYGLSFLIVFVNVVLYQIFCFWWDPARVGFAWRVPTFAAARLMLAAIWYGNRQLSHPPFDSGPRIAALQGNVPQELKMKRGDELLQPYLTQWQNAREAAGDRGVDLTIWPETSCPDDWIFRIEPEGRFWAQLVSLSGKGSDFEQGLQRVGINQITAGNVLLGLNTLEKELDDSIWKYNSAILLNGRSFLGRYDKMHLVPFGEYVPLRRIFPWLQNFTPYRNDYSCRPGEKWTRFPLRTAEKMYHFAVIICYEDSEPIIPRQYVRNESDQPKVDFFVNISNDGWFRGSEEHEQHLAICRYRAIETRRSVVRSVNMGISALIDPDGNVIAMPGKSWADSKAMEGFVLAEVPIDSRSSIYSQFGDWLPITSWLMIFTLMIFRPFRSRVAHA